MRRGVGAWVGCAILLAGVTAAQAAGHELTDEELRIEMGSNRTLASYVLRNGPPDLAEASFLADRPPWDKYEVRLYYVDMRKEISFARAWILGEPQISMVRNERPLTDEEVADLQSRARSRGAYARGAARGGRMGPAERAEEAARRAEAAAGRVEAAADMAERAADRAEAIVAKMETSSPRSRSAK